MIDARKMGLVLARFRRWPVIIQQTLSFKFQAGALETECQILKRVPRIAGRKRPFEFRTLEQGCLSV